MNDRLFAVRGATQVAFDDKQTIEAAVIELFKAIIETNKLSYDAVVSVQFTITPDLHTYNPATALRNYEGTSALPLLCMQEPIVDNMLDRAIRVLIHYYASADHFQKHVYLHGAASLRPDLVDFPKK